jgi:hypothetical protein
MSRQQVGIAVAVLVILGLAIAIYFFFRMDIPPCARCEKRMLQGGGCEYLIETQAARTDQKWHHAAIEVIQGDTRIFQPLFEGPVTGGPQTRRLDNCPETTTRILFELYEGEVSKGFVADVVTVVEVR